VYHIAHSPPFNTLAMIALLTGIGLVTGTFYLCTRDAHGTVIFHSFRLHGERRRHGRGIRAHGLSAHRTVRVLTDRGDHPCTTPRRPVADDLPSTAQLLRSTVIAAAAAGLILVTVVLPAEYGIDPTGIGRVRGLTQMGSAARVFKNLRPGDDEGVLRRARREQPPGAW
jgi:hypothetical protein